MDGSEMRTIRKALGLRQVEFGEKVGRSLSQISRYEKGHKPIPDELAATVAAMQEK